LGLIQEVQTLKRQNAYNAEDLQKEILKLRTQLQKAQQEKEYQKDLYIGLENGLQGIFDDELSKTVNNNDLSTYEKNLTLKYNELKTIERKAEIIKQLQLNDIESQYISNNYLKILSKIYKEYQEDLKSKKEILESDEEYKHKRFLENVARLQEEHKMLVDGLGGIKHKKDKTGFYWFMNKLLK